MRFLHRNTPRQSDEALSVASSMSADSFEVFGSACSDYSECEHCEDRRQRRSRRRSALNPFDSDVEDIPSTQPASKKSSSKPKAPAAKKSKPRSSKASTAAAADTSKSLFGSDTESEAEAPPKKKSKSSRVFPDSDDEGDRTQPIRAAALRSFLSRRTGSGYTFQKDLTKQGAYYVELTVTNSKDAERTFSAPSPSTSRSYHTAMEHSDVLTESAALLNTAPRHTYSSTSGSDSLGAADLSTKAILATYRKLENQKKPERKKQSSLVTIFSIWNTTLGSSLLTMAWGVERAGLLPGLVMLIVMGALCLFTAYLLLNVNRHHGGAACEVPALCRQLLGPAAERLAHAFSLLVLLGANVVYWILITNFLYYTVNYFMDLSTGATYNSSISCASNTSILLPPAQDAPAAPAYWRLHATVPLYVAAIVFPLLNFRNATFFTKFNSLGTLSVFYLLLFVAIKGWVWGVHVARELTPPHARSQAAVLSGMLALSFYIHNILITIMNGNERQENNGRDLTIAFVLITLTYMLVGCVFYVCFPLIKTCIEDNMLNNFEMHDVMTAVARMLLLFQVITVFPLVAFMLRTEAILLLPLSEELKQMRRTTVAVNVVIVTVCILFACFCPSIGTIIRYTGAAGGLVHIFTLPSLLQLRSLHLRGRLTCWKTALYCGVLLVGPLNLLLQFYVDE